MEAEHHRLPTSRQGHFYSLGGSEASELWIVLHGYGQRGEHFIRHFRELTGPDRRVVAPEGLSRFYLDDDYEKVGASWMTRLDREDEVDDQLDWLDAVAREIDAASRRVTLFGFSQGAPTAGRWLLRRKIAAERLICWGAGLPHDVDLATVRRVFDQVRLEFVVGREDEFLTTERIARERGRMDAAQLRYQWHEYEGNHRVDAKVLQALA